MSSSKVDYWREYRIRNREKLRAYYARPEVKSRRANRLKKWSVENAEKRRISSRKSRLKHRAKRLAETKAWHEKNKSRVSRLGKFYKQRHRARYQAYNKLYHSKRWASDPEYRRRAKDQSLAWGKLNPDKRRKSGKEYARRNPHVFLAKAHKYRALRRSVTTDISGISDFIKYVKSAVEIRCFYCDNPVPKSKRHIDHKVPLIRGGKHELSNLCCACQSCNCRKSSKTPEEFALYRNQN